MRIFYSFTLLLIATLECMAASPDSLCLTLIEHPAVLIDYHLRIQPSKTHSTPISLIWNYSDDKNYNSFEITFPAEGASDPLQGFDAKYRVIKHTTHGDSILNQGSFSSSYSGTIPGLSLRLLANSAGATIKAGGARWELSLGIPFDHNHPKYLGYRGAPNIKTIQNDIICEYGVQRQNCTFTSLESLSKYLEESVDYHEGIWKYLDRNVPKSNIRGGEITFATISDNNGGYYIVYLNGDSFNRRNPLEITGHLTPTLLGENFDMMWIDGEGRALKRELNAEYQLNGSILSLYFPLYEASLRYRKIPLTQ